MLARVVALTFLTFLFGSATTYFKVFPATHFIDAFKAGKALSIVGAIRMAPMRSDLWNDNDTQKQGVTRAVAGAYYPGFTLFTSTHKQSAFLIDEQGKLIHEWHLRYRDFMDENAEDTEPLPENFLYMRKAHVFPNGDLLTLYVGYGKTPWGLALVKMDKDSNLIWKYQKRVHHDFDIDAAGNIYTLGHHLSSNLPPAIAKQQSVFVDDTIIKLSPGGEELQKFSVMQAIAQSDYARVIEAQNHMIEYFENGDFLHTNAIEFIDTQKAGVFPVGKAGQVLISMRELNSLAVIDLVTKRVTWLSTGAWIRQHDPDILPNGNILLFDNKGVLDREASRVIEIDPQTGGIVWSFAGSEAVPFYTARRGSQQPLPNGNILITESGTSRLLEVNRDGKLVWEYVSPVRRKDEIKQNRSPVLCWAQRYDKAQLQFAFNGGLGD